MSVDPEPQFAYDPAIERVTIEHVCTRPGWSRHSRVHRVLSDTDWTVESREPLTVTPAVYCPHCGLRGYIAGGLWRAA